MIDLIHGDNVLVFRPAYVNTSVAEWLFWKIRFLLICHHCLINFAMLPIDVGWHMSRGILVDNQVIDHLSKEMSINRNAHLSLHACIISISNRFSMTHISQNRKYAWHVTIASHFLSEGEHTKYKYGNGGQFKRTLQMCLDCCKNPGFPPSSKFLN